MVGCFEPPYTYIMWHNNIPVGCHVHSELQLCWPRSWQGRRHRTCSCSHALFLSSKPTPIYHKECAEQLSWSCEHWNFGGRLYPPYYLVTKWGVHLPSTNSNSSQSGGQKNPRELLKSHSKSIIITSQCLLPFLQLFCDTLWRAL